MTVPRFNYNEISVSYWYSLTCKPCVQIKKILPRLRQQIAQTGIEIDEIDVDGNKYLALSNSIRMTPTFVIKKDGVEVKRFEGVVPLAEIGAAVLELTKE